MKRRSNIGLAILGCVLAIYFGSYAYFSAHGRYGPEYLGSLIEGPEYNWEPMGFHNDSGARRWNHQVYIYLPLFFLDRAVLHPARGRTPPRQRPKSRAAS